MKTLSKPYLQLVTRDDWGASPPRKPPEPLHLPVKMLLLFDTQTEECTKTEECKKIVKRLQQEYMYNRGLEDIPWNFLIGADGRLYEGRGWKVKPFKTNTSDPEQMQYDGCSVDVAYIGDYRNKLPADVTSPVTISLVTYLREQKCVDTKSLKLITFMLKESK